MTNKQTAVKWLQEQLKKGVDFNPLDKDSYLNNVEKLFEQAKQMEKDQIEDAFSIGYTSGEKTPEKSRKKYDSPEQYYLEIFKSEK